MSVSLFWTRSLQSKCTFRDAESLSSFSSKGQVQVDDFGFVPGKGCNKAVFLIHKAFGGANFATHVGREPLVSVCRKNASSRS